MKYFLHDTNAFQDEKISELFMEFGYEGLGLFYTILEKLALQEKPVKTTVLKRQLFVGKKLEKCWEFMESLGIISSNNGETFNKQLLNYAENFKIKKEKNKKRISEWRENQEVTENVTRYNDVTERVRNTPKVNRSKVKESKVNSSVTNVTGGSENLSPEIQKKNRVENPKKNKEFGGEKTLFWGALVDTWFKFYESKKGETPTFTGAAPKDLKAIAENLQKRSVDRGEQWTEEIAVATLARFLTYAYSLPWLCDNFLLSNLNRQFDKIITTKNGQQQTSNYGQPATGANVNVRSAFDAIDRYFGEDGGR